MTRRDRRRSLSVPVRLIDDGQLEWSAVVPSSDLTPDGHPNSLRIADVEVPSGTDVCVDVILERTSGGLSVVGEIVAAWQGPCARCWITLDGEIRVHVREVFTATPIEGEQYLLEPESVNLVLMVREAVLLELPIEAVPCPNAQHCPNLPDELLQSGDEPPEGSSEVVDPRWAALDILRNQSSSTRPRGVGSPEHSR